MKLNHLISGTLMACVMICSCQKENSNPQSNTGSGSGHGSYLPDTVFLTRYVSYSNIPTIPIFTKETKDYYYDNLNRVQAITQMFYPPPPSPIITFPDSIIYFYNGTDTLPYKGVHYNRGAFLPVEYYTWDGQARITKVQVQYPSPYNTSFEDNYSFLPNQIIIAHSYAPNSFDTLAYDGNNITHDGARFDIQLDTVRNPFYQVILNRHIPQRPYQWGLGERLLNKNPAAKVIDIFNQRTMNYQYDSISNGLPAKVTSVVNSVPDAVSYFFYRH